MAIPAKSQFLMWFAGLRGAIAYGLAKQWRESESVEHVVSSVVRAMLPPTILSLSVLSWH